MPPAHVPITMGSERFRTARLEDLWVTEAWFPPGALLEPHTHDRPTFAVMLEGSFELRFPGQAYDCPARAVFTEPAGERHANQIEGGGARVLVVQPDPARAELFGPCAGLLDRIHHFADGEIATLGRRAAAELARPDRFTPLTLEALTLEMLAVGGRWRGNGRRAAGARPPAWLARAREVVHERFLEGLKVADVAAEAGVHPAHLARVFRAHYRAPIGAYVRRLRLEWAAERLAGSDDPIAAIALRAGFADQSHFTGAFRRHTGRTPARYRAAARPNGARA